MNYFSPEFLQYMLLCIGAAAVGAAIAQAGISLYRTFRRPDR